MRKIIIVFFLLVISSSAQKDISKYFEGINGCFVLYDVKEDSYLRFNEQRCDQRFLPASTFKVPNSIIALEEQVIPDEDFVIKWDSIDRGWDKWNMDHNLRSGIKYSVVWFYQELARRIGREKYEEYLDSLNYGNKTIGEKEDYFWLDWSLQISANEQVEFLKKLVKDELPFSQRNIDVVKDIMIVEESDDYIIRAKTGLGDVKDGVYTGWYIGYVETRDNVYVFALNMDEADYEKIKSEVRIDLTKSILKGLNVI